MTGGRVREGLGRVGAFAAGVLLVVGPMMARNYHVSGEIVPLTTGGGEVFYIGNNENADGRYSPPPFVRASASQEHEDFRIEAARRLEVPRASLSRKEASDYWLGQGVAWIRSHPGDFLVLDGRKLLIFWNHYELPDNQSYGQHRRLLPILRLPLLTFALLVPLAAAGLAITASRWRDLLVLCLVEAGYVGSVMLFFNFGRFRLPAIPILMVLAGGAIAWLPAAIARRRWPALLAATAAALAAVLIASPDLEDDPVHIGQMQAQTAGLLRRAGRLDEADAESREAIEKIEGYFAARGGRIGDGGHGVPAAGEPGRPELGASFYAVLAEAYLTRSEVAKALGGADEAAAWTRRARAADPQVAAAGAAGGPRRGSRPDGGASRSGPGGDDASRSGSGPGDASILMESGKFLEAAGLFRQDLDALPSSVDPVARLRLALRLAEALHRGGRPREALEVVEKALDAAPRLPDADAAAAHYGEALIHRDLGQPELMRFHMRECLRLHPAHPRAAWMREVLARDAPKTP